MLKMKKFSATCGILSIALLSLSPLRADENGFRSASAEIINTAGERIGTVFLRESKNGLHIDIQASDLPPGEHGFHIHNVGLCTLPSFTTAGQHFNPSEKKHGLDSLNGPHAGDLPNLQVAQDGTVASEYTTRRITLEPGSTSLLKRGSTAIIIHANPDDQVTDPSGNSGDRIACGVIQSEK
jgi:Cu-Zn family superoxide dismutase